LVAGSLLLAGCGGRGGPPEGKDTSTSGTQAKPALTVTAAAVRSAEVPRTVLASGAVHPWQEVIVGAEVGGYRVAEVLVDVGSVVRKGQVLVRLSTDMLNADVASRRAALRSAEARALNAAAALRRGKAVSASGALSAADLDRLEAEEVAAQAQVETSRSDLAMAELRLRYTQVIAPDDGVITARTVSVGQIAQAGGEMLRLLRQSRVEWRAEVPEAVMPQLRAGQPVTINTAAGQSIAGTVRTVAPTVQASNRTGLVYVDITRGEARPGMFARGTIETGRGAATLAPAASLVVRDGYGYLFVLGQGDVVQRRSVQSGSVHGDEVEILSGVQPGERVVVKGAGFLQDGDLVAVAQD
jgi:RND family efflux transporter MFP subunit